jgi:hypothetical protein
VGAAAGIAAVGVGWWLALVVLLPVPLAPELALVVMPRRLGVRRCADLASATFGIIGLAIGVLGRETPVGAVAEVLGLACLLLIENPPRRAVLLPPLGVVVVVVPVAANVGAPGTGFLVATAAGVAYLAIVAITDRRSWWSVALVLYAAAIGAAGAGGEVVVVAGIALAAAWGPLPWRSRYVGAFAARRLASTRAPTAVLVVVGANALAIAAIVDESTALALLAVAALELGVFAVALAVRLWRFAPRRRILDLTFLAVAAIGAVAVVPWAQQGNVAAVPATLAITIVLACVAAPLAKEMSRTAPGRPS